MNISNEEIDNNSIDFDDQNYVLDNNNKTEEIIDLFKLLDLKNDIIDDNKKDDRFKTSY